MFMSPKRTVDNPIVTELEIEHSTEESQIPEIEDKGKELIFDPFSLPNNQSLLSSTQDSIKSLATHQEADLDDEQIRALLASLRYYWSEKQVWNDHKLITLKEKV